VADECGDGRDGEISVTEIGPNDGRNGVIKRDGKRHSCSKLKDRKMEGRKEMRSGMEVSEGRKRTSLGDRTGTLRTKAGIDPSNILEGEIGRWAFDFHRAELTTIVLVG